MAGEDLPRRTILVSAGALTLLAMSGCGSLAPENIRARYRIEKSLKSFEAVKSVNAEVGVNFEMGDSWTVLIVLNDDPGREETLAVLKDAYRRVEEVVGKTHIELSASWKQNGASVSWSLSEKESNEATLDYLRELAKPSLKSMDGGDHHISVNRGEVKKFPTDVIVAPRSGGGVGDNFDLDDMTIKVNADTVDLSSVPLREVLAVGTASLAFGAAGCSPMAMARKRWERKAHQYLTGLDAVASAQVDVHPEFSEPDRWTMDVMLKDDPSVESVVTVVRDAYAKVLHLTGAQQVKMVVTWSQGEASVFCCLLMKDAGKAASATVEAVSPSMERVQIEEERISFEYRTTEILPDRFILLPTFPVLRLGSLKIEQSILIGWSHYFVSHAKGKGLTSVPIKRALETPPSDKRYGAAVSLEAEDKSRHQTCLTVKKWGQHGQDEDVQPDAAVLATVLGNQVLQRVELSTSVESKVQPAVVGFDMKSGSVAGQGDPPERGAPSLPPPGRQPALRPDESWLRRCPCRGLICQTSTWEGE